MTSSLLCLYIIKILIVPNMTALKLPDNFFTRYSNDEIIDICKLVNREYNIFDSSEVIWNKIMYCFYKTPEKEFQDLKKIISPNAFINEIIMNFYACERVVKYHLMNHLHSTRRGIITFEMPVGDSRVDICQIGDSLNAYEIKTEYDNYSRIASQMNDYMRVFDKVYTVVPINKYNSVVTILPQNSGIITYSVNNSNILRFSYRRKATKNNYCDSFYLSSLSSHDLSLLFRELGLHAPRTKAEKQQIINEINRPKLIRSAYKKMLIDKYQQQWNHLISNIDNILPIDFQTFYSTKMEPSLLYDSQTIPKSYA